MNTSSKRAWDIVQDIVDRMGQAHVTGNFDGFAACYALPTRIETFQDIANIETKDQLTVVFERLQTYVHSVGLTDMVRRVIAAEFTGPDTLTAAIETRLMSGTTLLADPYPTYFTLKDFDGAWKITEGKFAIQGVQDIFDAVHGRST